MLGKSELNARPRFAASILIIISWFCCAVGGKMRMDGMLVSNQPAAIQDLPLFRPSCFLPVPQAISMPAGWPVHDWTGGSTLMSQNVSLLACATSVLLIRCMRWTVNRAARAGTFCKRPNPRVA